MRFPSLIVSVLILSLAVLSLHCSVGEALSRGYTNTVAYFNSYYNASRTFHEAEEEVLENERTVRLRDGITGKFIDAPGAAKTKFNTVIDKCSNILSFQSESALVDDALFLIGRSYFYLGEFVKAERKFTELRAMEGLTDLADEADWWRLRTLARLRRDEEVVNEGRPMAARALEQGREDRAAEIWLEVGKALAGMDDHAGALESFRTAVRYASDDEVSGLAQYLIGQSLASRKDSLGGAEEFLAVMEMTDRVELLVPAGLRALESMWSTGAYERGLEVCERLRDDYRFQDHRKQVEFEEARMLLGVGRTTEAVDLLVRLDTMNTRTEIGTKAAFQLGRLRERQGDLEGALASYSRATSYPVPGTTEQARTRASALGTYFTLTKSLVTRDSVIQVQREMEGENQRALDSLFALQGGAAFGLAEVFYSDLGMTDSARSRYEQALEWGVDSTRRARALYILAELTPGREKEYYERTMREHPRSPYARLSALRLGLESEQEVDPAAEVYRAIETRIDTGDAAAVVSELRSLVAAYPASPFAAKSLYAMGWLYEHRLGKPDSALTCYTSVMEQYRGSQYAEAVRARLDPNAKAPQAEPPPDERTPGGRARRDIEQRPVERPKVIE